MFFLNPSVPPLFVFLIVFLIIPTESAPTYRIHFCYNTTFFNLNSTYQHNLNFLLSSLSSNSTRPSKFYNLTAGQDPSRVYGLFLCRQDLSISTCRTCLETAGRGLTTRCPQDKEAIIWYDECMLRYSNRYMFSRMEVEPYFFLLTTQNISLVPDLVGFNASLVGLFTNLLDQASSSDQFSVGTTNSSSRAIYGLLQCTPDLSRSDCNTCLARCVRDLQDCCYGRAGARVLKPSCSLLYETYPFINSTGVTPRVVSTDSSPESRGKLTLIVLAVVIPACSCIAVLLGYLRWRRRSRKGGDRETQLLELDGGNTEGDFSNENFQGDKAVKSKYYPLWRLSIVHTATQHFSESNKLGQGGFGPVYKGILPDGKEIAVKRLSRSSGQGLQEFKTEVLLIAKLQHRNLVRLLGCCLEGNEKLLIYEFMPNKSLDVFLFDPKKSSQLDWKRRLSIINGIARGLLYLHEDSRLRIIHRDLKASNILLDHEMNPKISDFGMARIFGGNQIAANTNRVVGTYGYMAPEYAMGGLFSVKSDIFSFGVLMLEIISGKRNNGFYLSERGQSLLTFAWRLWSDDHGLELMDSSLRHSCFPAELLKCIHIGLLCVQEDPADRPTMSTVISMLTSDTVTLSRPKLPAFSVGREIEVLAENSSDRKACSINEVTLSRVAGR